MSFRSYIACWPYEPTKDLLVLCVLSGTPYVPPSNMVRLGCPGNEGGPDEKEGSGCVLLSVFFGLDRRWVVLPAPEGFIIDDFCDHPMAKAAGLGRPGTLNHPAILGNRLPSSRSPLHLHVCLVIRHFVRSREADHVYHDLVSTTVADSRC